VIEFFKTLYQYRGILFYRTLASLRADTRAMYLGYLWWFLEPILNTALYYFIFGVLLGTKTPDFIAYLLSGTVIYQWYQSSIVGTMGTITARAHLYRQIPLPKYLFGIIGVCSSSCKSGCVFVVMLVYISITSGLSLGVHLFWLPFLVLIQILLIAGFSIILSIASAYLRDLQTFTSVLFRAGMFLSAIFWDVSKVPEHLKTLFYSNPSAALIQVYRSILLHGESPSSGLLLYLTVLSLILIQLGMLWHRRVDGHILKHIQT
jgi:ABC-type polysaccharide/polyol phosphate export permease